MDYYQLLEVSFNAKEKDIRRSYLKLAKKYHPDVYNGVNKDHFKRVAEAYNTLKNPKKRLEYDNKHKFKTYKKSKAYEDYQAYAQRMQEQGREFSHDLYEEFKRRTSRVRDEVDPEFEEELKKHNFSRMFREF